MSNNENQFTRRDIHENDITAHVEHIGTEFRDGFEFLKNYPKSVTIFGSARVRPENENYKIAMELAGRVVTQLKYAVVTGGGPGTMEAANKGAYEARGISIGLNISLPHERATNPYVTHSIKFSYFFTRKTMLTFAAEAFVFFPGGFGTFDELFSIITLIQTGKIPRVPVILFGSDYWNNFRQFISAFMCEKYKTVEPKDLEIFEITDSMDRALEIIEKAPLSDWWRNIN